MTRLNVEPLGDVIAEVGESPIWDHRSGELVWVDIHGGLLHRTNVVSGTTSSIHVETHVGAVGLAELDRYLLAVKAGLAYADRSGIEEVIDFDLEPDVRMNDGKVDCSGRFVAGTMAYDTAPGRGVLYSFDSNGENTTLLEGVTISNGIAWSLDYREMYYVDSATGAIDAFEYDLDTGGISSRRTIVSVSGQDGIPDGLTVDRDGFIWVALYGGGAVRRYTPTGEIAGEVSVPTRQVTACAFGGPDLDTLFITSAWFGLAELDRHADPLAGRLFVAVPGVRGRHEPVFGQATRSAGAVP